MAPALRPQPPLVADVERADDDRSSPRTVVVVNRLPPSEIARASIMLLAVLVGAYLLWRIQEVLFVMFLAILLATAIQPIVDRLRRGPFTRGSGVLVVYTAIVLALGLPLYVFVPSLSAQAGDLVDQLPERIDALRSYAMDLQPRPLRDAALAGMTRMGEAAAHPAAAAEDRIVEAGATAVQGVLRFLSVFVLALYWLLERASIKRVLLRAVPMNRAREVNEIWLEVEEKLGGWVRGQLLLMLAIGVMAGVGFLVIGLPNPALLGVAAGLFEIVPMIGPFLAFAPAVLTALTVDPSKALIVLGYAVVIQQIESNVLLPRVMGRTVGVSPLTVLLGILVGSVLAGLPGAFLAVPVAAAIQVILAHFLRAEDPSQDAAHAVGGATTRSIRAVPGAK